MTGKLYLCDTLLVLHRQGSDYSFYFVSRKLILLHKQFDGGATVCDFHGRTITEGSGGRNEGFL